MSCHKPDPNDITPVPPGDPRHNILRPIETTEEYINATIVSDARRFETVLSKLPNLTQSTDLETENYRVCVMPSTGGCYFIERLRDGYSTAVNTGAEAVEEYKRLERLWRKNPAEFDFQCSQNDFFKE